MENKTQISRHLNLLKQFERIYGRDDAQDVQFVKAPARINIIGEHIDYIDYFQTAVLTFGSAEYDMIMAFRPRKDGVVKAATLAQGFEPVEFSINEFQPPSFPNPDARWKNYLLQLGAPAPDWSNYIKASVFYLQNLEPQKKLRGMEILVDSVIPIAGGASSSSALVVASGAAIRAVNNIEIKMATVADHSSKAEWFVGTRGGKMDHATLCFSQPSNALLTTFKPFSVKRIPMPLKGYSWVTFYTYPADKGSQLTAAYNERSIVSRFVIPNFLEEIFENDKELKAQWAIVLKAIAEQSQSELNKNELLIKKVLDLLPQDITLKELEHRFNEQAFKELKALYSALFKTRAGDYSLKVRDRARHHLGEIARVIKGAAVLGQAHKHHLGNDFPAERQAMQKLGQLINETHTSLRDLYQVSADDLNQVVAIARQVKGVLGARVMGGGFGGNVLVLTNTKNVPELIKKVESQYYLPRKKDSKVQKNIMITTSGQGAEIFDNKNILRLRLMPLLNDWQNFEQNEKQIFSLAEKILETTVAEFKPSRAIKPVIAAGGKGKRAKQSGLKMPKIIVPINGEPVVRYILKKFFALPFPVEKPVVVVSPGNETAVKKALAGYDVDYTVENKPLGTAHAVLSAREYLTNFKGDVVVLWGKQPTVRVESIFKTILLHQALGTSAMSFPTAKRKNPYAPIKRGEGGWIEDSVETHLEEAKTIDFGEDNIGLFVLPCGVLLETLQGLHNDYYLPQKERYNTPKGELGFPNMMVRRLTQNKKLVFAFAMADPMETKGINTVQDIKTVEKYCQKCQ